MKGMRRSLWLPARRTRTTCPLPQALKRAQQKIDRLARAAAETAEMSARLALPPSAFVEHLPQLGRRKVSLFDAIGVARIAVRSARKDDRRTVPLVEADQPTISRLGAA